MNRRDFLKSAGTAASALMLSGTFGSDSYAAAKSKSPLQKKTNVLFIAVDDLRPELGCYGADYMKTPNIDKLAKNGVTFKKAYCQQAVCNPSRVSILTGLRPDSAKVTDLHTDFRDTVPWVTTLPQHFLENGYHTESIGKIAHKDKWQDDKNSWSVPSRRTWGKGYWQSEENKKLVEKLEAKADKKGLTGYAHYKATLGPPTDDADIPDGWTPDGDAANMVLDALDRLATQDKPFFLGAGFFKPHLPFSAPKKYWDMYNPEDIELPEQTDWPKDMPETATTSWGELRGYYGMPKKGKLSDEQTRHLIHGYRACVSFTDAQIGKIVSKLDELGLRDNTVIILWGDHGWKLGEYGAWCKHTNFGIDTNAPMIIDAPGYKEGVKSDSIAEFLDIYPTLCDLCGLSIPEHCQGKSLKKILKDPEAEVKQAALSQWAGNHKNEMGYSLRTDNWRYIEWINVKKDKVVARELYDHRTEGKLETVNLAYKEKYKGLIEKLSNKIEQIREAPTCL